MENNIHLKFKCTSSSICSRHIIQSIFSSKSWNLVFRLSASLVEPKYKILQFPCGFLAVPCDSMYRLCNGVQNLAIPWRNSAIRWMEYKILQFPEGIQRSGEWNTKSCNCLSCNLARKTEVRCRSLQGKCIPSTRLAKKRRFTCKTLYSLSTRDAKTMHCFLFIDRPVMELSYGLLIHSKMYNHVGVYKNIAFYKTLFKHYQSEFENCQGSSRRTQLETCCFRFFQGSRPQASMKCKA